jgi:single-strand DNA-binding protein
LTTDGRCAHGADASYLGKGSHVNVVGRVRSNTYEKDGETIYGLAFTCDEIDYLDNKARAAERRSRHEFVDEMNTAEQAAEQRAKSGI